MINGKIRGKLWREEGGEQWVFEERRIIKRETGCCKRGSVFLILFTSFRGRVIATIFTQTKAPVN